MNKLVYVLMSCLVGVNALSTQSQNVYTIIPYQRASKKVNFLYADSCRISVVYSDDNDIAMISCADPSFSVEGVRPGQKLAEKLKGKKIEYLKGWDYYINITGNWYAGFGSWYNNTEMPTDTSTITYLYWFKFNYDHPYHNKKDSGIQFTEEELKEIEKMIYKR